MTLSELLNRFTSEQNLQKRWLELIEKTTLQELERMWNEWDGIAVMKIDGEYVPESYIVQELHKRGSKADYLP